MVPCCGKPTQEHLGYLSSPDVHSVEGTHPILILVCATEKPRNLHLCHDDGPFVIVFIGFQSLFQLPKTDEAVENAVKLDGSEFKGRTLKVHPKRVNVAGFNQQHDPSGGRGRGGRGFGFRGGGGRGFRGGGRPYRGGYRGGRGRGGFHPYY